MNFYVRKSLLLLFNFLLLVLSNDTYKDTSELIVEKGYQCEEKKIDTKDGFVLGVHRIPNKGKPPVVIWHGVMQDSSSFFMNYHANQILPMILFDEGYDIWLPNTRGTFYSLENTKYDKKSKEFWDWSFDEIGDNDVPAVVDYILQETGHEKLTFICHSMGCTAMWEYLSFHPEFGEKLNIFISLAPPTTIPSMSSPFFLAMEKLKVPNIMEFFHVYAVEPDNEIIKLIAAEACKGLGEICEYAIFLYVGYDTDNLNKSRLPVIAAHADATSAINLEHGFQVIKAKSFQKFDYGKKGNLEKYGTADPPLIDISNVNSVPLAVFYGTNDILVPQVDMDKYFFKEISKDNLVFKKLIQGYNHIDFVAGEDANEKIYPSIVDLVKNYG